MSFLLDRKQKIKPENKIKTHQVDNRLFEEDKPNKIELKEIETPKREALLLSPSALVQVGASPSSQRYSSIRKLEFENFEKKRNFDSIRKLNFFK